MKRGNTALKRGVGLASAFALAIAGAVIAAPAANAAVTATEMRATPAVDAPWITSTTDYTNAYSGVGGVGTGEVPDLVIGQNSQAASGFQMLIDPGWTTNTVTFTLNSGGAGKATFSQAPSAITLSKKSVAATDDTHAGHAGTNANPLTTTDGVLANNQVHGTLGAGNTTLTVTLPDPTETVAATSGGYLLSVEGVRVNVPADQPGTPGAPNQELTVTSGSLGATIGYINNLKLALNGTATANGNVVKLPPVVVAEGAKDSFDSAAADTFWVTVVGTPATAGGEIQLVAGSGYKVQASDTVTFVSTAFDGDQKFNTGASNDSDKINLAAGSSDADIETVVISGLQVNNVKPGTELTVAITSGTGSSTKGTWNSGAALAASQTMGASATVTPGATAPRIAGANRYATAADIAEELGATGAVIIANGENGKQGVDALSANFLAGVKGAPILLTQANTLPAETKAALTKLFDNSTANITVYVMGKTDSVSQSVRDEIVSTIKATAVSSIATVTVKEVAGDNRYATSAATLAAAGGSTSAAYYDLGKGNLRTAFLASGQVNADALAAGAVSAGSSIPVLLTTDGATLPSSVSDAITNNNIGQIIILGSTDRVSQAVEDSLTTAGVKVIRLAGTGSMGRYDTAVMIANLDRKSPTDGTGNATGNTVYLASGNLGWPDALAAGPLVANGNASLITVNDGSSLPSSATLFLANNKVGSGGTLTNAMALGGTDRVSDAAVNQAQGLLS